MIRVRRNVRALDIIAEMNINTLEKLHKDDVPLLFFLGCAPAGLTVQQLNPIWSKNTSESLKNFEKLSFLEQGHKKKHNRIVLANYMIRYVRR